MKNDRFELNEKGYFKNEGVDIMSFNDFYPVGHQSGVTLVMNGKRLAANGDIRLEQTPGQWQPVPKQLSREEFKENNEIVTKLRYPDIDAHLHGFNPMIYPDIEFEYEVSVKGVEGGVEVKVNLDRPISEELLGKVCFNLELFPKEMFSKSWIMDDKTGLFPRQANAPTMKQKSNIDYSDKMKPISSANAQKDKMAAKLNGYSPIIADDIIALPYATGKCFTAAAEDSLMCFSVESKSGLISLYDGRMNHNNGWFVLSEPIKAGTKENAISWVIRPRVTEGYLEPVTIQISQVGYHTKQDKFAYIELDRKMQDDLYVILEKITAEGFGIVKKQKALKWGNFLRYKYEIFDFSDVKEEGLYRISYASVNSEGNVSDIVSVSEVFKISEDVYERGVWQPVLEYFLPVQMCHMRVNEKYRVWHGCCHKDDARMSLTDYEQFDGASQGPSTYTNYKPGQHIEGLNKGGWHDAGDFDLRIESQTGEMYALSLAYEEFDAYIDETTIDQERMVTEIHLPDGKNDILQQIEHGALSVIGAYKSLGRLYHEIMCSNLRQYVLLGDAVNMTPGNPDNELERWVFTENNPPRELDSAANLAASYRALKDLNKGLAEDCLKASIEIFDSAHKATKNLKDDDSNPRFRWVFSNKVHAACELFLSTGDKKYKDFLLKNMALIEKYIESVGWMVARCIHEIDDKAATAIFKNALMGLKKKIDETSKETPYKIPYRPQIWGAGWNIEKEGVSYYFLRKAFPEIFDADMIFNSLNFILGCHPGKNTASFVSGVGNNSATVAYGANRADWSYIPGGVISGTALIRPDLPELLEFPYLWQQTEYCLGGWSSYFVFLVLAVQKEIEKM